MAPADYIAGLPEPKRSELERLDELIRHAVPAFKPYMAGNMIGYGKYHYRYDSGREGDSCRVGLASSKTGISVYIACVDDSGQWVAEKAKDRLGKASVGKSCIRFKRLVDINLEALTQVLKTSTRFRAPGETTGPSSSPAKKRGVR